jgi:hypothetical protein
MKTPADKAAAAHLARRRAARLAREAAAQAGTGRPAAHNIYLLPKREKPTADHLGAPSPEIRDVGGYDLNGNPL